MIWPFRRHHLNRYSVATEIATFGQRLCDLIVTAGPCVPPDELERRYAALVNDATARIMALEVRR